jgi:glycosyltransferase involved in cell wall biosynthesis
MDRPVCILHAHSIFALGGKEARAVRLMNAFGDAAEHSILSGVPDQLSARDSIERGIRVDFPSNAPPLTGRPGPRLWRLARYMRRFDLVLTYNWGAFDAVMARRLFGGPPLVHHEDGFNQDEASGLKPSRNAYRKLGLGAAYRLVVPSGQLEKVALSAWAQKRGKVERIPNGIPVERFASPPAEGSIPGLERHPGDIVIGTVAGLRPVKNLPRLVRALAGMREKNAKLVIVGQGPESERIVAEARRLGVADRLILPGFLADPARYIGLFDIFALSSNSEQFPISLVEAMAAGLPVVATAVGDVPAIVSADNRPLIVEPEDEAAFSAALDTLAERADLRRGLGEANRERAAAEYDERRMIERYARLYGEAIGRPRAFMSALAHF